MTIAQTAFTVVAAIIAIVLLFGFVQNIREREFEQATIYGAIIAFIVTLWWVVILG